MRKEKPTCCHCGSDNVLVDAYAEWDADKQEWVLLTTFDDYYCQDCCGGTSPEWIEIPEKTI